MYVQPLAAIAGLARTEAPGSFLGRLARLAQEPPPAMPLPVTAETPAAGATALTPQMLRAALLDLGAAADSANMALAEALTQLGLPLTASSLAEAHVDLARAPGATPTAFALAKALSLPTSPAALQALSVVTGGIPAKRALAADLMDWLGLSLDAEQDPEALTAQIHLMTNQIGRSTEHRLAALARQETPGGGVQDTRSILLRLAQAAGDKTIQIGADTLASHIEGQQLINHAALHAPNRPDPAPLYFALPWQLPGEQTMAEMRLWPQQEQENGDEEPADTAYLRATVRLATTRLGRLQADLSGTAGGLLTCRLGSEKPATHRLLGRHSTTLAASLKDMGWRECAVSCALQTDWTPLWHGGQALATPRARVDHRA